MVVAGFVADEPLAVDRAAEEFEAVIQTGHRLQILELRSAADGGDGKAVELLIRRSGVARELNADVTEDTAVVGVARSTAVRLRRIRRAVAGAFDRDRSAAIDDAVADDDQSTPVAGLACAGGPGRREDDRVCGRALRVQLRAARDEQR